MQDHTLQRTTRRIDFGRAGFVLLTVVADPFALSYDDRQFVFTLLDSIDDHKSTPKERDERERDERTEVPREEPPIGSMGEIPEPELENAPQYLTQALIGTEAEAAERAAQEAALAELQAPPASTFNRTGIFGHVYETDPGMQRRLG